MNTVKFYSRQQNQSSNGILERLKTADGAGKKPSVHGLTNEPTVGLKWRVQIHHILNNKFSQLQVPAQCNLLTVYLRVLLVMDKQVIGSHNGMLIKERITGTHCNVEKLGKHYAN